MKRRTFIQQSAVLSTVTLLSSPLELIAKENSNCELNLASFIATGKKAIVNGFAIDAVSKDPIKANIQIASDSGFYTKTRTGISQNGQYSIVGNVLNEGNHKIKVKIEADGYKTFIGTIYLTRLGCRIDSQLWSYNPDFRPDFIPKNEITDTLINSKFNFHLVKA